MKELNKFSCGLVCAKLRQTAAMYIITTLATLRYIMLTLLNYAPNFVIS